MDKVRYEGAIFFHILSVFSRDRTIFLSLTLVADFWQHKSTQSRFFNQKGTEFDFQSQLSKKKSDFFLFFSLKHQFCRTVLCIDIFMNSIFEIFFILIRANLWLPDWESVKVKSKEYISRADFWVKFTYCWNLSSKSTTEGTLIFLNIDKYLKKM